MRLWLHLLHYEGTPGLWQTLLHLLNLLRLPYAALNITSGLLGVAGAWMLARHSPFPLPFRLALPFTFFLAYQYAVVARSYALLPVLLFGCAHFYAKRNAGPLTALLCLTAFVSVHGLALSGCIWLAYQWRERQPLLLLYVPAAALALWCAWPAGDQIFIPHRNYRLDHLGTVVGHAFTGGFTGDLYLSLAAIALSLPFLWRGRALLFFALACVSLSAVFAIVYSQVWHFGILFLAWIFAFWIAAAQARPGNLALAALGVVIAVQVPWTAASISWDWSNPYSGARAAALYLRGIPHQNLYAVGYACTGIQPYFPANIFANWHSAYWDWSSRNHSLQDIDRFAQLRPDYVIVGHTNLTEQILWNHDVKKSGYVAVKHFEGNLYWRDDVFEPDAFDLYRRRDLK